MRKRSLSIAQRQGTSRLIYGCILSMLIVNIFQSSFALDTPIPTLRGSISHEAELLPAPVSHGIVGLKFMIQPKRFPYIAEVYPDTPAAKVDLKRGDKIIALNSLSTKGLSTSQVDKAISDVPGDIVTFLVRRKGQVFPVNLTVESLDDIQSPPLQSLYAQAFE